MKKKQVYLIAFIAVVVMVVLMIATQNENSQPFIYTYF